MGTLVKDPKPGDLFGSRACANRNAQNTESQGSKDELRLDHAPDQPPEPAAPDAAAPDLLIPPQAQTECEPEQIPSSERPARTSSESSDPQVKQEFGAHSQDKSDSSHVSAYARLDFESFTFYVQTLQVMLGRKAETGSCMVDVHLGLAKAISRRHAKIFYNFGTQRFELSVLGRNGAFVGDVFTEAGSTVPLEDGTKVQIGQIPFTFVLPVTSNTRDFDNTRRVTPSWPSEALSLKDNIAPPGSPIIRRSSMPPESKTFRNFKVEVPSDVGGKDAKASSPLSRDSPDQDTDATTSHKRNSKVYAAHEIPAEFRDKPNHSYSHLIATSIKQRAPSGGMTLGDIYKAIMEFFPYYKYCPAGWQNSVRHNLSSNKMFRKVAKEGKGWLWGIDEEYIQEREMHKKKALVNAAAKQQRALLNHSLKVEAVTDPSLRNAGRVAADEKHEPQPQNNNTPPVPCAAEPLDPKKPVFAPETIKTLALLQQRITNQLKAANGGRLPSSATLTNALALAIAKVAKTGGSSGANGIASLLNGKNPTQLAQLLTNAVRHPESRSPATAHNSAHQQSPVTAHTSTNSSDFANQSRSATTNSFTPANQSSLATTNFSPPDASVGAAAVTAKNLAENPSEPSTTPVAVTGKPSEPSTAPVAVTAKTLAEKPSAPPPPSKPPMNAATISKLIQQARQIKDPSPNILAALKQLEAHAARLRQKDNTASHCENTAPPNPIKPEPPDTVTASTAATLIHASTNSVSLSRPMKRPGPDSCSTANKALRH